MNAKLSSDVAAAERLVAKLAADRGKIFAQASCKVGGLSTEDQHALAAIERQLDESFNSLREKRALRDSQRFDRDRPYFKPRVETPVKPAR